MKLLFSYRFTELAEGRASARYLFSEVFDLKPTRNALHLES